MSQKTKTSPQATGRGLGRGLDALFRNTETQTEQTETPNSLSVQALMPFSGQPRMHFDEVSLEELAASIKNQGVVQPLIVRSLSVVDAASGATHEIIAGERRWRAAKRAGLQMVPVIVRNLSDTEAYTIALIENVQREDLNPYEEAQALQHLRDRLDISQEELATRLGKSRPAIANALRLLQLPEYMQKGLQSGAISGGHGRALLSLLDSALQESLYEAILARGLSVRDVEAAVQYAKKHQVLPKSLHSVPELAPDAPAIADTADVAVGETLQTDNQTTPKSRPAATRNRRGKSPEITALQKNLRKTMQLKVNIAGDLAIGRITLPYDTEDELHRLCQLLGGSEPISSGASANMLQSEAIPASALIIAHETPSQALDSLLDSVEIDSQDPSALDIDEDFLPELSELDDVLEISVTTGISESITIAETVEILASAEHVELVDASLAEDELMASIPDASLILNVEISPDGIADEDTAMNEDMLGDIAFSEINVMDSQKNQDSLASLDNLDEFVGEPVDVANFAEPDEFVGEPVDVANVAEPDEFVGEPVNVVSKDINLENLPAATDDSEGMAKVGNVIQVNTLHKESEDEHVLDLVDIIASPKAPVWDNVEISSVGEPVDRVTPPKPPVKVVASQVVASQADMDASPRIPVWDSIEISSVGEPVDRVSPPTSTNVPVEDDILDILTKKDEDTSLDLSAGQDAKTVQVDAAAPEDDGILDMLISADGLGVSSSTTIFNETAPEDAPASNGDTSKGTNA